MKHQSYDAVVVGAGIWGCTVARRLADKGRNVLVLERCSKTGGACSSHFDINTGDEVHDHGPHVFHTDDEGVWRFVGRFAEFNHYRHSVVSLHGGKYYRMPVGLDLVNKFFHAEFTPKQAEKFMSVDDNRKAVFDAFFRGYSMKQWGFVPDESVTRRVRVGLTYSNDYFSSRFQGVPVDGYQSMFRKMLDHWRITVQPRILVGSQESDGRFRLTAGGTPLPEVPVYCSAPPDELFGYKYGELPYRTASFVHKTVDGPANGCAVVNFADMDRPETRCTEWRHFHQESANGKQGVVTYETPSAWSAGNMRYWPVVDNESADIHMKYLFDAEKSGITLGGRLGWFTYIDMDDAVRLALDIEL